MIVVCAYDVFVYTIFFFPITNLKKKNYIADAKGNEMLRVI